MTEYFICVCGVYPAVMHTVETCSIKKYDTLKMHYPGGRGAANQFKNLHLSKYFILNGTINTNLPILSNHKTFTHICFHNYYYCCYLYILFICFSVPKPNAITICEDDGLCFKHFFFAVNENIFLKNIEFIQKIKRLHNMVNMLE